MDLCIILKDNPFPPDSLYGGEDNTSGFRSLMFNPYQAFYKENRPFADGGHIVQSTPYWNAKAPIGIVKQRKITIFLVHCVLFWSLRHSFAFQYCIFCTM